MSRNVYVIGLRIESTLLNYQINLSSYKIEEFTTLTPHVYFLLKI